ncbi:MAG: hypothetical protein GY868_01375 [Deltaproteobacteria bacterium]|nr:hypothetical protein [Deltaproteobacteria bacterium]
MVIGLLFWAGTFYPVVHHDDQAHHVHPLAHSAVCKWVKNVKLCNSHASAVTPVGITYVTVLVVVAFLVLAMRSCELPPFKHALFVYSFHNRAPPC